MMDDGGDGESESGEFIFYIVPSTQFHEYIKKKDLIMGARVAISKLGRRDT